VSITGARSTSTPARKTWEPQVRALDVSVVSLRPPWVSAVGILEKPVPWSTWTYPPSWSVATSSGTRDVAADVVNASTALVRARTGAGPAVVRPVSTTFPTW
jgi:hypothetical protein